MIEISSGAATLVKVAVDVLSKIKLTEKISREPDKSASIERHFRFIDNWSSSIGLEGFILEEKKTDDLSISLQARFGARRWRIYANDQEETKEIEAAFFESGASVLLTGDPGSGKTTTIKRIIRSFIYPDIYSTNIEKSSMNFPVLIRGRNMKTDNIFCEICDIFDISYSDVGLDAMTGVNNARNSRHGLYVYGIPIENYTADFVEKASILICIDGIDEISTGDKAAVFEDISSLSLHLRNSAILATCRSGDVDAALEGVSTYELIPLTPLQVRNIVDIWLADGDDFIEELSLKMLSDVASRPIFLVQLIIIYLEYGYVPEQAAQIQDRMLDLMLNIWDKKRGVKRKTRYARFIPEIKLRFLSDLAFWLIYKCRKMTFDSTNLRDFYVKHADKYELPKEEIEEVIGELESHTGIINKVSENQYEFSHLSVHEHLAAKSIAGSRNIRNAGKYCEIYYPPIAVAIGQSQKPSEELFYILNRIAEYTFDNESVHGIEYRGFLQRMHGENPLFDSNIELALATIFLINMCASTGDKNVEKICLEFCGRSAVINSFKLLLKLTKEEKQERRILRDSNGEKYLRFNIDSGKLDHDQMIMFNSPICTYTDRIVLPLKYYRSEY